MAAAPLSFDSWTPDRIFLRQGQTVILPPHEHLEIFTPLGSCVSCILFHPQVGTVMTHAKLPQHEGLKHEPGEIVELSTSSAIEHFAQSGVPEKNWDVMLFGGGIMHHIPGLSAQFSMLGWQNIISALRVLQEKKLHLSTGHFGGFGGRRIYVHTGSGQATHERLGNSYGGISVSSRTPIWLLLESMQKRVQKMRDAAHDSALDDDLEEFNGFQFPEPFLRERIPII